MTFETMIRLCGLFWIAFGVTATLIVGFPRRLTRRLLGDKHSGCWLCVGYWASLLVLTADSGDWVASAVQAFGFAGGVWAVGTWVNAQTCIVFGDSDDR